MLIFALAARPRAKIRGVLRSMRRGIWLAGWLRGWGLLAGCWDGVGWLVGWLRVVVLKVGERLAGGTSARVYCEGTGLFDAL